MTVSRPAPASPLTVSVFNSAATAASVYLRPDPGLSNLVPGCELVTCRVANKPLGRCPPKVRLDHLAIAVDSHPSQESLNCHGKTLTMRARIAPCSVFVVIPAYGSEVRLHQSLLFSVESVLIEPVYGNLEQEPVAFTHHAEKRYETSGIAVAEDWIGVLNHRATVATVVCPDCADLWSFGMSARAPNLA